MSASPSVVRGIAEGLGIDQSVLKQELFYAARTLSQFGVDADDALQDMAVRWLSKPPKDEGGLRRTAIRCALIDAVRRQVGRYGQRSALAFAASIDDHDLATVDPVEPVFCGSRVRLAVKGLPPLQRDVIERTLLGHESLRDLVEDGTAPSYGNAHQRRMRAVAALRRELARAS
jgi:DNA-directed RNA polymerase specialized sigma24 family protein